MSSLLGWMEGTVASAQLAVDSIVDPNHVVSSIEHTPKLYVKPNNNAQEQKYGSFLSKKCKIMIISGIVSLSSMFF